MAYVLLIAGILLIAYGLTSLKQSSSFKTEHQDNESTAQDGRFDKILTDSEILRQLEIIDEKIDALSSSFDRIGSSEKNDRMLENLILSHKTQLNIVPEDVNDINSKIIRMKNEGMDIERIAGELGLMKGEVLLRLGMKK